MSDASKPLFTIGYGARTIEAFIDLLRLHEIAFLIDVRSRPYSRYKPDFSKKPLAGHLENAGIRYVFMGDSLGGQPEDPDCYTDGKVDYQKVAEKEFYIAGIGRLQDAWRQGLHVAIMCSEGKPENCHRTKLIGRTLNALDITLAHIDENGQMLDQDEVMRRVTGGQPTLFGDEFTPLTSRKRYDHNKGEDLIDD